LARIEWRAVIAAAILVGGGGWCVADGMSSSSHDEARARRFRTEPSCSAAAAAAGVQGVCRTEPVTVVSAHVRWVGSGHGRTRKPYVSFRVPYSDAVLEQKLYGSDGVRFAERVRAGARGYLQTYHGEVVRVAADGLSAEAPNAPDAQATEDRVLALVGAGLILGGLGLGVLGGREEQRAAVSRMLTGRAGARTASGARSPSDRNE
jgi:hypothetical protein